VQIKKFNTTVSGGLFGHAVCVDQELHLFKHRESRETCVEFMFVVLQTTGMNSETFWRPHWWQIWNEHG